MRVELAHILLYRKAVNMKTYLSPNGILELTTPQQLREVEPVDLRGRYISEKEFFHILRVLEGYWEYQGPPRAEAAHAILTSGLHSNKYLDCSIVLVESNLCEILAFQMARKLREVYSGPVDWVVGPGNSAIDLVHDMARSFNARHWFTEKDSNGKPMIWKKLIREGETVLIASELATTEAGSAQQCKDAVAQKNLIQPVSFAPFVPIMADRCKTGNISDGTPVVSMYTFDVPTFKETDCPYCAAGSKAYDNVKSKEVWEILNGRAA